MSWSSIGGRTLKVLGAGTAGLVLAACGSSVMAGNLSPSGSGDPMMGGDSRYHPSRVTCAAPSSLPGQIVHVTLADMGMSQMMGGTAARSEHMLLRATPSSAAVGVVSLVASNLGWRTHELVVLPLVGRPAGGGVPGADGKVPEVGSLGEASRTCGGGAATGIPAGSVSWVTLTLAQGTYELICNLPNHYADGMHELFVVR